MIDERIYIGREDNVKGANSEIASFEKRAMDITVGAERRKKVMEVPIWEKSNLTLDEAAAYSGIGKNKLREISNEKGCTFVLFVGGKRLIKRKKLDEYIEETYAI